MIWHASTLISLHLQNVCPGKITTINTNYFLLEDNQSLATGFHFTPNPCEARPEKMMKEIANALSEALKNAIPCEKNNPWILQLFIERCSDLSVNYQNKEEARIRRCR